MKNKFTKPLMVLAILLLSTPFIKAIPIEAAGKYKSHTTAGLAIRIKCGWQWWNTCFSITDGLIWVDNYDHVIGWACSPLTPPGSSPIVLTNEQLINRLETGNVYNNEDEEMETWYTFTNTTLVEDLNP